MRRFDLRDLIVKNLRNDAAAKATTKPQTDRDGAAQKPVRTVVLLGT